MSILSKKIFVITVLISLTLFVGRFCLAEFNLPIPAPAQASVANGCTETPAQNNLLDDVQHHNQVLPCCATQPASGDQAVVASIIKINFSQPTQALLLSNNIYRYLSVLRIGYRQESSTRLLQLASTIIRT